MAKPFPWFYAVNDRPVTIIELPDGGSDCLVFESSTGNLVPDRSYFAKVAPGSGKDVDELTPNEFAQLVAARRVDVLRRWSERLCDAKSGVDDDLVKAIGVALEPPPLGASEVDLDGGEVGSASIELIFPANTITRAELERRFSGGRELPHVDPRHPHTFAYDVAVAGAAHRCTVFASVPVDSPNGSVTAVTLRLDRAPSDN